MTKNSRPPRAPHALEIKVDLAREPAWMRAAYRRIAAGESPHEFLVTERIHFKMLTDKALREKIEAERAEAQRVRGGRRRCLTAKQAKDGQAVARQRLEEIGGRKNLGRRHWILVDAVREYFRANGVSASKSTVSRHVIQPVLRAGN
jgi:hypothetical protein